MSFVTSSWPLDMSPHCQTLECLGFTFAMRVGLLIRRKYHILMALYCQTVPSVSF